MDDKRFEDFLDAGKGFVAFGNQFKRGMDMFLLRTLIDRKTQELDVLREQLAALEQEISPYRTGSNGTAGEGHEQP